MTQIPPEAQCYFDGVKANDFWAARGESVSTIWSYGMSTIWDK